MQLIRIVSVAICFGLIEANYVRVNNTGTQDLLFIIAAVGYGPDPGYLIQAGSVGEYATLNEWQGSFYAYPNECSTKTCDYPVTKINVVFEQYIFDGFYDFLMLDLNHGFNIPASIKSIDRSDCPALKCEVNLLELCSEEDIIRDDNDKIVSCKTSTLNYQDFKAKCPDARVDGNDLQLGVCASMDYEITFG